MSSVRKAQQVMEVASSNRPCRDPLGRRSFLPRPSGLGVGMVLPSCQAVGVALPTPSGFPTLGPPL